MTGWGASSPPRRARRSAAGRGKGFEALVQLTLDRYAKAGLLVARRIDTGSRAVRQGSQVRLIPTPSPPDFVAVLAGGRSMVFDAKEELDYTWSLDLRATHQLEFMARWATAGALCFFLVECRPLSIVVALRVPPGLSDDLRLRPAVNFRRPETCIWPYVVVHSDPSAYGQYDWLPAVLTRWNKPLDQDVG